MVHRPVGDGERQGKREPREPSNHEMGQNSGQQEQHNGPRELHTHSYDVRVPRPSTHGPPCGTGRLESRVECLRNEFPRHVPDYNDGDDGARHRLAAASTDAGDADPPGLRDQSELI